MPRAVADRSVSHPIGVASIVAAFSVAACPGPDRITEPLISAGGAYFASFNDAGDVANDGGNGGSASGGATGGTVLDAGGANSGFDWGPAKFDRNGGAGVAYQEHYIGDPCFGTCHVHTITIGGTVYRPDGVEPAANVEIGVWLGGTLYTSYSGASGNFFTNFLSPVDWTTAKIAVRSAYGVKTMLANPNASGDCNRCHGSRQRIIAP